MSIEYDRPFKTYEEQLVRLEEFYGLKIENFDFGKDVLKTISYYDLINRYQECFMNNGKFLPGINLQFIFNFSIFDKNFQNILLKYSIYIENSFKTKLSYVLGKNFGVHQDKYLNIKKYKKERNKEKKLKMQKTLDTIKEIINNKKTDNPTRHYRETHNHIPPWILFKNITFNTTIDTYSMLKKNEKEEIIESYFGNIVLEYDNKAKTFKDMLSIVRKYRNKIAHNNKIMFNTLGYKHELLDSNLIKILNKNIYEKIDIKARRGTNDFYAMIISTVTLLDNHFLTIYLLQELIFLLNSDKVTANIYIEHNNLPSNLIQRLTKLEQDLKKELGKRYIK